MRKMWSKDEVTLLQKLYECDGLCPAEISVILNRTNSAITEKIQKLKFKHTKEQANKCKSRVLSGKNNPMYGKAPWSKGQTKETNVSLKSAGEKISALRQKEFENGTLRTWADTMRGKLAWNSGLSKEVDERIRNYGKLNSTIKKNAWLNLSEEERNKRRIRWAREGQLCKKKDTSIEKKIEEILIKNGIVYKKQFGIDKFTLDFYILKKNVAIECQGDYWHANPLRYNKNALNEVQIANIKRDEEKSKYLIQNNIRCLFIWECDINHNLSEIEKLIKETCL